MICEKCGKNPAAVQTKITINGKTTVKNLCESCWAQENGFSTAGFTVNDLIKGFMQNHGWNEPDADSPRCSQCGTDLATFSKTGLLGCAHCYETFRPYLNASFKKMQGSLRHVGHRPNQPPAAVPEDAPNRLDALKAALAAAVKAERYEEAAVLRDRIRAMENETQKEEA